MTMIYELSESLNEMQGFNNFFMVNIPIWFVLDCMVSIIKYHRLGGSHGRGLVLEPEIPRSRYKLIWYLSFLLRRPLISSPPSWPHLTLVTFQRDHLQIPPYWALGIQHVDLGGWGLQTIFHNTNCNII